ncbi:MAG: YraN family protein [Actinobacteria bacterium]|nr:MAG: YraN family protein [Actinomycetota bacterium]TMK46292.1 MAG: YraN family protein [Actinomycetota bacterium]
MAPHAARASLGRAGEDAAAALYARRGFRIVARNWRCALGELDLIVEREGTFIFCEVKARRGDGFGGGYEAVTARKQRKLRQLAEVFVATVPVPHGNLRFDVASVHVGTSGTSVELFEDAF